MAVDLEDDAERVFDLAHFVGCTRPGAELDPATVDLMPHDRAVAARGLGDAAQLRLDLLDEEAQQREAALDAQPQLGPLVVLALGRAWLGLG